MPDTACRAAALLLKARSDPTLRQPDLPSELRPVDRDAAYAIQRVVAEQLGPIGGWKVSPFLPDGPPFCGPLPASGIAAGPATLAAAAFDLRGVEAELAVRLAHDLPPRATPYTGEEVAGAITAVHPVIEVLQSRFIEPAAVGPLTGLADTQAHGALVVGAAVDDWRRIDFAAESVVQSVDGEVNATRTGHPGGELLRQVVWLANEGSVWAGGLKAGQIVTCGSWTGANRVGAAARVRVVFSTAGEVVVAFAA